MKFLNYSPFEGREFQFMGRVVGFHLCQISTSYSCLVEHSLQARPAGISMELKWLVESA